MDHPPNKLLFVIIPLFFLWFLLLYNFDWAALPRYYSVSLNQHDFLPSIHCNKSNTVSDLITAVDLSSDEDSISNSDHHLNIDILEKDVEHMLPREDDNNKEEQHFVYNPRTPRKPCSNRYVYIQEIPDRFNLHYLKQCQFLDKWQDMCPYFENQGLGRRLRNPQRLLSRSGWYDTSQFSLEIIFHSLMKQYECLTNDSSKASAVYIPYYAGLDASRYLFDQYASLIKDADALALFRWLRSTPQWRAMDGRDHFLVAGRTTWDFRREKDDDNSWGSKLMLLPEARNMTMLTIESSPWDRNDFAIPYPTYFHPSSDKQVSVWQNMMRRKRRRTLFCFTGAARPNMESSIRSEIMQQCTAARRRCKMTECKSDRLNCLKPENVMRMFQGSVFCLEPPGDSFTRRSTFDAILAGCIPVFFTPASSYVQYLWHLPRDFRSYSVLIPEKDVKENKVNIEGVLSRIPKSRVSRMREKVIRLIPNVVYSDPRSRLKKLDDAFDLAIKGVVERIGELKKGGDEFHSADSWKHYTFRTKGWHEWDHYFTRNR